jgi:hypothetical protein
MMAEGRDRQGTGRHPHKSTDEPYPHTREQDRDEGERHTRAEHAQEYRQHETSGAHRGGAHAQSDRAEQEDLKRREYRDEKGEVHHHTRTYMEQHRGEKK